MPPEKDTTHLRRIVIDPADITLLLPLLQQGVQIEIENDHSLDDLLCRQLGLDREYVLERISTLFLNSRPVDDIEKARVADGATLALSCAMPGLIGATMRRGGVLASFRSSISYRENQKSASANRQALITIKLFNMLTHELGPVILTRGVIVMRKSIDMLFPRYPELATISDAKVCLAIPPDEIN